MSINLIKKRIMNRNNGIRRQLDGVPSNQRLDEGSTPLEAQLATVDGTPPLCQKLVLLLNLYISRTEMTFRTL